MKKILMFAAVILLALLIGFFAGRVTDSTDTQSMSSTTSAEREILYWVAPMDPNFRRDEPGKSPMGMDLVPVYADEVDGRPGVVSIDPTVVNNLGVRTGIAESGPLARRVDTVGYVAYDEDTLIHVHTRVDGWIETLAVNATGDAVQKGQLLFELYSPTLVNAQQEYLAALRSGNGALIAASKDRLHALGVGASELARLDRERRVSQRVRVYAEDDGIVTMLGVREGIYVTPATDILSIGKLDTVWVLAEVFERQASWVRAGQHAMIELDYAPGRNWHGPIDYVYPELDPVTRTLTVRLKLDNEDRALQPNMFARVTIHGDSSGDVVHVPRSAVIRGGSVDRVVVAIGEGRFRAQPVKIGIESGNRVEIERGIAAGERVVVSGQFLIDSESNIDSALSRLGDDDEPPPHIMDHSGHTMPDADAPMDHSGHTMPDADAPMDHSGHTLPDADPPMDHSGHTMPDADASMDHSGHSMPDAEPPVDHSGHPMSDDGIDQAMDHEQHKPDEQP